MSSYDNPRIIQDLYGSMAWAKAAAQLSGTLVKSVENINAVRAAGYEKARKKQEKFSQLEASVSLAKNEALRANKVKIASVGDEDLNTRFLNTAVSYMNGDENRMGSIEAETLYRSCNGCSKKQKQEYQRIIDASNTYQDNMIKFAANITPNLELINDQNQTTVDGYFWAGDTTLEQVQSLLTGNYLDNTSLKGVKSTKNIETEYDTGVNTLYVDHKIELGSHIARTIQDMGIDLTDKTKFSVDKDGYVTIPTFEKKINTWDGVLLKKKLAGGQMIGKDGILDLTDVEVDDKFNEDLKVGPIISKAPHIVDGKDTGKEITYTDEYIDIGTIENSLKQSKILDAKIDGQILSAGIEEQKNYITSALNVTDEFDDDWFLQSKEDRIEDYKGWIINQYLRSEGLLLGDPGSEEVLRNLNESGILRKITPNDAAIINKDKDADDDTRVKAGNNGYFIRKTKIPTEGTGTSTNLATHVESQKKAMLTPKPAKGFAIYSKNDLFRIINTGSAENPIWVQEGRMDTSTSLKSGDDPDIGTTNVKTRSFVPLSKTTKSYIIPGIN